MNPISKLVPGGILETKSRKPFIFFCDNNKTSDFIFDGIIFWWESVKSIYKSIDKIVINLDNGPECSGRRSYFLQRMVEFVDKYGIEVRLVYYPPYHSKYNSIEHYWGGLERSWNGYLLDSIETVLNRAENFSWKGQKTTTILFKKEYKKGLTLNVKEKRDLEKRIKRSIELPIYDITILPL